MVGIDGALGLYINTYFWELKPAAIFIYAIAAPIGVVIGSLSLAAFMPVGEKARGHFWYVGLGHLPDTTDCPALLDFFPANHTAELLVLWSSSSSSRVLPWSRHWLALAQWWPTSPTSMSWPQANARKGSFLAPHHSRTRAPPGLAPSRLAFALDLINWPTGQAIQSAADIPAETLTQLALLYGPIVSGFAVVSVWCYSHYDLSRQEHQSILEQLTERRAQVNTDNQPTKEISMSELKVRSSSSPVQAAD